MSISETNISRMEKPDQKAYAYAPAGTEVYNSLHYYFKQCSTVYGAADPRINKFVEDFLRDGSAAAYASLHSDNAPQETHQEIEKLVDRAYQEHERQINLEVQKELNLFEKTEYAAVSEFFRVFMREKKYEDAIRAANEFLKDNPSLLKNEGFQERFHQLTSKFKPKKEKGMYEYNITPDGNCLFKLTLGRRQEKIKDIPEDLAKKLILEALNYNTSAFIKNLGPQDHITHAGFIEKFNNRTVNHHHDLECLFTEKRTSLSSQLAKKDVEAAMVQLSSADETRKSQNQKKGENERLLDKLIKESPDLAKEVPQTRFTWDETSEAAKENGLKIGIEDQKFGVASATEILNEFRTFVYEVELARGLDKGKKENELDLDEVKFSYNKMKEAFIRGREERATAVLQRYFEPNITTQNNVTANNINKQTSKLEAAMVSHKGLANVLNDLYALYLDFDRGKCQKEIEKEIKFIAEGKTSAFTKSAEIQIKNLKAHTCLLKGFTKEYERQNEVLEAGIEKGRSIKRDVEKFAAKKNFSFDPGRAKSNPLDDDAPSPSHSPGFGMN